MEMRSPRLGSPRHEAGIALPVMMIVLMVMIVGSVYMFKSSNSAALMNGNLAYQSSLSKAADLGLMKAAEWLDETAKVNSIVLENSVPAQGYVAIFNPLQTPSMPEFWAGSAALVDTDKNHIEYVVHRLCAFPGNYASTAKPVNNCVRTSPVPALHSKVPYGASLGSDAEKFNTSPQVHYVITSRISGPRGGNVVNQMIVMIGV